MNFKKAINFSYAISLALSAQIYAQSYDFSSQADYYSSEVQDSPYQPLKTPLTGNDSSPVPAAVRNDYNAPMKLKSQTYNPPQHFADRPMDQVNYRGNYEPEETFEKIDRVLKFWFGPLENSSSFPVDKIALWEGNTDEDQQFKNRFLLDYQNAAANRYTAWNRTPQGRLALIILLDLFPRHIYPNQAKMFATDPMALALAREGIRNEEDLDLLPVERIFFYLPFQQSENREMQALSVNLYRQLVQQSPEQIKPIMQEFLQLAVKHKETIDRFGRFPHRNKILGRESTPEELDYLNRESSLRS